MKNIKIIFIIAAVVFITMLPVSAMVVFDNMDDGKPYNARVEKSNIMEGGGAVIQSGTKGTLILQRLFEPAIDIAKYRGIGLARLYLYIEDTDNLDETAGQLELTSSGKCDAEETSWQITKSMLENGWNTLIFPLESPGENAADLSAINYFRVYIHIKGKNTLMLDELAVGTEDELGIEIAAAEMSDPVKDPSEVYGEGGAVGAALAFDAGAKPSTPIEQDDKDDKDDKGDKGDKSDCTADGETSAQTKADVLEPGTGGGTNPKTPAVIIAVISGCCVLAAAVYFIIKRGRRK